MTTNRFLRLLSNKKNYSLTITYKEFDKEKKGYEFYYMDSKEKEYKLLVPDEKVNLCNKIFYCLEYIFSKQKILFSLRTENLGKKEYYFNTTDDMNIILISILESKYFDTLIKNFDDKRRIDTLLEYNKIISKTDINTLFFKTTYRKDDLSYSQKTNTLSYYISCDRLSNQKEVNQIRSIIDEFVELNWPIEEIEKKYYDDYKECYNITIRLGDNKNIVIRGVELSNILDDKTKDLKFRIKTKSLKNEE